MLAVHPPPTMLDIRNVRARDPVLPSQRRRSLAGVADRAHVLVAEPCVPTLLPARHPAMTHGVLRILTATPVPEVARIHTQRLAAKVASFHRGCRRFAADENQCHVMRAPPLPLEADLAVPTAGIPSEGPQDAGVRAVANRLAQPTQGGSATDAAPSGGPVPVPSLVMRVAVPPCHHGGGTLWKAACGLHVSERIRKGDYVGKQNEL